MRWRARAADVTVLDMRAPGRGASQASAGILAPYIEAHEAHAAARSRHPQPGAVRRARRASRRPAAAARSSTRAPARSRSRSTTTTRSDCVRAKAWLDAAHVANEWLDPADPAIASSRPSTSERAAACASRSHGFVGVASLCPRADAERPPRRRGVRVARRGDLGSSRAATRRRPGRRSPLLRPTPSSSPPAAGPGACASRASPSCPCARFADNCCTCNWTGPARRRRASSGDRAATPCRGPTARCSSARRSRTSGSTSPRRRTAVAQADGARSSNCCLARGAPRSLRRAPVFGPRRPTDCLPSVRSAPPRASSMATGHYRNGDPARAADGGDRGELRDRSEERSCVRGHGARPATCLKT